MTGCPSRLMSWSTMTRWSGRQSPGSWQEAARCTMCTNRVTDIADVAGKIQQLVPEANVAFAHGQMKERELEDIMYDFINGDIDVLVSTTIIETGLDISNANTMIIQDADRFGLSQLYQLRGRVGRSEPDGVRLPSVPQG